MVQIVRNLCDLCGHEFKNFQLKIKVTMEYSSRSHYSKEYCSINCVEADLTQFKRESDRRDLSS